MNPSLENIIVLQSQDLELKRLRAELIDAPKRVAAAELALKKSQATLAAAKAALHKEEALRRSQQSDVTTARGKITRLGKQMESATSAAQITALQHEMAFGEQAISTLEDEELASMERTETFESHHTAATALLESTTNALAAARAHAATTLTGNSALIAGIESERKTLRTTIASTDPGEALLSTYDRIAKAKGTGISEALDHKCTACQMMVRPQRWNDLTGRDHDDTIFHCETCGRILFHDPRRHSPGSFAAGDRLNTAARLKAAITV